MPLNNSENYYLQVVSDLLSIITIVICFILKVPQIIQLVKVKNSKSLSMIGLLLELTSYTITMTYNYRKGYAILSYLEYPIILIQEIILIFLFLHYNRMINSYSLISSLGYFIIFISLLLGWIPLGLHAFLVPLCTPIGCSSKVVQLMKIFQTKDSSSISLLTWFISAFTNFTRVFTVTLESGDLTLLLNFSINTFLSSAIMMSAYYYKTPKKQD